ncbi:hypothetical protein BGZ47_006556 [Haplosporangium gracile]|nr:hypothetical protein BGZ47_006556 [Haplosporangium gracile]
MLGSDSGSSDLSEASSLSSDNSSGSEADIKDALHQQRPPKQNRPGRSIQRKYHSSSSSSGSDSGSGSGNSSGDDSTDLDDDGNHGQGKRPPQHIRLSTKYPSKAAFLQQQQSRKDATAKKLKHDKNAPISLSDSLPVYSQEIMNGSMMATAAARNGATISGRGRGRGRGRAPLAGHGSRKHDTSGATVIDFDASSPPPEESVPPTPVQHAQLIQPIQHIQPVQYIQPVQPVPPVQPAPVPVLAVSIAPFPIALAPARKKKDTLTERPVAKVAKTGSGSKPKAGAKKVGRPKTISKDVYCICRGPYDGVEFMIACDRCEEWFHGRCIGMKPQEAKKSNHYYCDTCQRIRRMFGVTSAPQESVAPPKPKAPRKKSADKRPEKQSKKAEGSLPKLKLKTSAGTAQAHNPGSSYYSVDSTLGGGIHLASNAYRVSEPVQVQAQQSFPAKQSNLPTKTPKSKPTVVYQDRSATSVTHLGQSSNPMTQVAPVPSSDNGNGAPDRPFSSFPSTPAVYDDDEDEDVCPVCEDQCTCNNDGDMGMASGSVSTRASPEVNEVHSMSAIKVPFQPNLGSMTSSSYHHPKPVDHPSIDIEDDDDEVFSDDAFQVSQKNPMVTPTSQRRPSILQRSGKGIGKMPSLMQSAKKTHHFQRSQGKSFKSSKASRHMYKHSMASAGSGDSDSFSEDEEKGGVISGSGRYSYVSDENDFGRQAARYGSDSDDVAEGDDLLSMGSASSLSDFEDEATQDLTEQSSSIQSRDHHLSHETAANRLTSDKGYSKFRAVVPIDESSALVIRPVVVTKKRGPGRPKKPKVPLVVSREDEHALYTPAVISRKVADPSSQKRGSTKAARSSKTKMEFPFIAYDPGVAENIKVLNAAEHVGDDATVDALESATPMPDSTVTTIFGDEDIFGDGDLSDELSGDLSDILSEDLDDLSDDGLGFTSTDAEDDTSTGSSPREFNYSEMEEQDESLVDSDSSINSITSKESDSSDPDTESDIEPHFPEYSDQDELSEHEGSEDLIDDEELMRLEEQERLYLAKAQLLHDVFSEDDSDPGRNPFESSEDEDDDGDDERSFESEEDQYSDEFYEDDYYEDEYDDMDENAILEQLQGTQTEMQALLMIPSEQQEQLLLLQHYAETHRLQQEQLQQKAQDLGQPISDQTQSHLSQDDSQMSGMLSAAGLLPPFDVNVPDLDAVSEQLAASLANSLASSMAEMIASGQPEDAPLFPTAMQDISQIGQMHAAIVDEATGSDSTGLPTTILNVSPVSSESVTPESSIAMWNAPLPSSPSSVNTTPASIPTPANTPNPPGTATTVSPSLASTSENTHSQPPSESSTELSIGNDTQDPADISLTFGLDKSSAKIQSLPNSPSYKPLASLVSTSVIGGRQVQSSLLKLGPGESIGILAQTRLQNGDPCVFKDAAQRALGSLHSGNSTKGSPPQENVSTGDTTDDASPSMHSAECRKRKGDEQKTNEVVLVNGKRRRLSTAPIKSHVKSGGASESHDTFPAFSSEITESLAALINSTAASSLSVMPSGKDFSTTSASMSPTASAAIELNVLPSNVATTGSGITVADDDFSKASMPFIDPAARIIASSSMQKPQHAGPSRGRKFSLKGKESRHSEATVLPMDDLLDTSALYGRSSSRSPSPSRDTGEGDGDSEMSQSMKDLNRWERVPIGTFRRSRRPSSSYVGLHGALKFGNVTMPTTLLADHQQHQQQLAQESHSLHRRTAGVRKHKSLSSASDIMSGLHRREGRGEGSSRHRGIHERQEQGTHRARAATVSTTVQTPPSVHAGMLMEDLAGFGSPDAAHRALGTKFPMHRSQSSLGSLEGSLMRTSGQNRPLTGEPMKRRRRAGSNLSHAQRPGIRLARSSSSGHQQQHPGLGASGLDMAFHHAVGLSIGMAEFAGSGGQHSKASVNPNMSIQTSGLQDLMTDSSQLPSSACPTPLHSPLFSATNANSAVHHNSAGEPVVSSTQPGKMVGLGGGNNIVPHLDLDFGKEMEGFQERLAAKPKAAENKPLVKSEPTSQPSQPKDEHVNVDIEDEDEEASLKAVLLNATF